MRPDQERVRNLLIDTVTLLCKNSVQFKDELHVEGLLGVSVDKKDVFFVHISKEFTNSPSEGASVTHETTDTQDEEAHPTDADTGDSSQQNKDSGLDRVNVKQEAEAAPDEEECLIVEDPTVKLEGVASPAQMVAGQRRAQKRTSHGGGAGHYDDGSQGGYSGGAGYIGDGSNSGYKMGGEPFAKRRALGQGGGDGYDDGGDNSYGGEGDDSYGGEGDDSGGGGGQGWPTIAGVSGFDPSQTFHDSDNSQMSMTDGSQQPGCSSWTAGPSDSMQAAGMYAAWGQSAAEQKVFRCPICDLIFFLRVDLNEHIKTHGENPFQCTSCDKRFSAKSALNKHVRRSHSQTGFECPVCKQVFTRKDHMNRHMKIHTGERDIKCPLCDKTFYRREHMVIHTQTHHSVSAPPPPTSNLGPQVGSASWMSHMHEMGLGSLGLPDFSSLGHDPMSFLPTTLGMTEDELPPQKPGPLRGTPEIGFQSASSHVGGFEHKVPLPPAPKTPSAEGTPDRGFKSGNSRMVRFKPLNPRPPAQVNPESGSQSDSTRVAGNEPPVSKA